jgi:hypothetical protein
MILAEIILVAKMESVKKSSIQIVRRTFALVIVAIMALIVNFRMNDATIIVHQNQFVNQNIVES